MKKFYLLLLPLILFCVSNSYSQSDGIVINEIYIGGVRTLFGNDSYIELYNPSTTTKYLDGCLIIRVTGNSGGYLQPVSEAWKFEGDVGGKGLPLAPGQFAVICASAKKVNGGLDLSNADFETFTGVPILDADNPSSKNLRKVAAGAFTVDINISQTTDAIALTNGTDTVLNDGIDLTSVIDGVQYSTTQAMILPTSIDAGFTGGAELSLGKTMERTQKGVTTHNSGVDFSLYNKPSPGYQTGSEPAALPKATDIFPLVLGKYVTYDSYVTDANGLLDTSTKTTSSSTVWRENQSVDGFTNVAWIKDTSNMSLFYSGDEVNLRYRADENQDIDVLADQDFIASFVSSFFAPFIQTPNTFVDYFKLSAGFKNPYPVLTLAQDLDFQGVAATINVTTTGVFDGIDTVTVPAGKFDSAYKFVIKGDVVVSVSIVPVESFSASRTVWLVKDIGIVKTNTPTVETSSFPIFGSERQMTAYGTRFINGVVDNTIQSPKYSISPNPASSSFEIKQLVVSDDLFHSVTIEMFDVMGRRVKTIYEGPLLGSVNVQRDGLASGVYVIRVANEHVSELHRIVIQ